VFPRRATTIAAVAAVLLTSAPAAQARPAGTLTVSYVLETVTRLHWSADADGRYRVTTYRELSAFKVVFLTTAPPKSTAY